mgnify:CR=1 FL=1
MRNGNAKEYKFPFREKLGSYPTYEEWKHATFLAIASFSAFVLILPMRNGNFLLFKNKKKDAYVLILPMRNGNYYVDVIIKRYIEFLSYL